VRFLVWEAASASNRTVPGERERRVRLAKYGSELHFEVLPRIRD
jgi:hypothetical protein